MPFFPHPGRSSLRPNNCGQPPARTPLAIVVLYPRAAGGSASWGDFLRHAKARGCYLELNAEPLRLALDDEGVATDGELIAGTRVGDLARPQLEGRGRGGEEL